MQQNKKEEVTERPSVSYPRYITVDEPDGSQPERQPTADDVILVGSQIDDTFEDAIGNRESEQIEQPSSEREEIEEAERNETP